MKQAILFLPFILSAQLTMAQDPNLLWVNSIGSTDFESAMGVDTDQEGNTFVAGSFSGTVDFDPGSGTTNLTSNGSRDIYVAKYDFDGQLVWAHHFGSSTYEGANDLVVDVFGNVYITGTFQSTIDFDPGAGNADLTSAGVSDIFVLKLDNDGNYVWAGQMGGSGTDSGIDLAVDGAQNIYLTGQFDGTADLDPGAGTSNFTNSGGNSDSFVLKITSSGTLDWAASFGGDDWNNGGYGVAVDGSGNVYVTGVFGGTGDMDPGAGVTTFNTVGYDDAYVMKLNNSGVMQWVYQFGSGYGDSGQDIEIDDLDRPVILGNFRQTIDFDPGAGVANHTAILLDLFVLRLNTDGTYNWSGTIGSAGTNGTKGEGLTIDGFNNIYITGAYSGTADFDPGVGTMELTATSNFMPYVCKINNDGNGAWVKDVVTSSTSNGGRAVALDTAGNVVSCGSYSDTADFDPGIGVHETYSQGSSDFFLYKLGDCMVNNGATANANVLTASQAGASYQWIDCDNGNAAISGATNQVYTATANGNYAVIVTMGACIDTSGCMTVTGVGINEFGQNDLVLYPNPSSEELYLSVDYEKVVIYNLAGKEMVAYSKADAIMVDQLSDGMYVIHVQNQNTFYRSTFIKE